MEIGVAAVSHDVGACVCSWLAEKW